MALATLSVDLVARLAQFEKDLGLAARSAEQSAQRMAGAFGLVKSSIGALSASVTVGALTAFVRNTINGVDALNDLKDATGASIENISALEDVAARTGTSFETVGTSLVKFNAALLSAEQVVNLFQTAGFAVGIGDWRPERNGLFGRFHVGET